METIGPAERPKFADEMELRTVDNMILQGQHARKNGLRISAPMPT